MFATSVEELTTIPNTKRQCLISSFRGAETGVTLRDGATALATMGLVAAPMGRNANMNTAADVVAQPNTTPRITAPDPSLNRFPPHITNPIPQPTKAMTPLTPSPIAPAAPPTPSSLKSTISAKPTSLAAAPGLSADLPISTRLLPDKWTTALTEVGILDKYSHIPIGLAEGFLIGVEDYSLSRMAIPPNHQMGELELAVACAKFADEILLGRISPGFLPEDLQAQIGNFRTAPIAVIQQKPGKFRIVVNHSYPRRSFSTPSDTFHSTNGIARCDTETNPPIGIDPSETSINSLIDSDNYPCEWGTFSDCFLLIADAPEG